MTGGALKPLFGATTSHMGVPGFKYRFSLPFHLPANINPGRTAGDGPRPWVPSIHMGDPE